MQTNSLVNFRDIIADTAQEMNNGLNVHDSLKHLSVPELRAICDAERFPFHVVLLSLTGDLNIGNMVRTACLSGAQKVWVFGRRRFDLRGTVGSQNYIDVEKIFGFEDNGNTTSLEFDPEKFYETLYSNKLVPVFVEHGGEMLGKFEWSNWVNNVIADGWAPALIMGNETNGIPQKIIDTAQRFPYAKTVTLPQKGVIRSYNVGVAMGMVTWDLRKDLGWI